LEWMGDDIKNGYPEGKFHCPTCNAKVGNWIWSGTQCSCGTWVVPAIQIPKGKVDVLTPTSSFALESTDKARAIE
jgi:dual specificity phosphatase 12